MEGNSDQRSVITIAKRMGITPMQVIDVSRMNFYDIVSFYFERRLEVMKGDECAKAEFQQAHQDIWFISALRLPENLVVAISQAKRENNGG